MNMNWDYIAGIFDGEGSVTLNPNGNHGNRPHIRVTIYNTNREVLKEIKDFCGYGYVYRQSESRQQRLFGPRQTMPCYSFVVHAHDDVLAFTEKILPLTVIKRTKLEALANAIKNYRWKQSPHPLNWDPETIRRLYWAEQRGSYEIARMLNTSPTTIVSYMRHHGIPRRPADQPKLAKTNIENVRALYWDIGMNQKKVGDALGTSRSSVRNFMIKHGIPSRPPPNMPRSKP